MSKESEGIFDDMQDGPPGCLIHRIINSGPVKRLTFSNQEQRRDIDLNGILADGQPSAED
ncbi:MAG: hypothetical protein KBA97_01295 [Methanothrix sp.]|nr:hypothetical protein [Methanothrix sp.]